MEEIKALHHTFEEKFAVVQNLYSKKKTPSEEDYKAFRPLRLARLRLKLALGMELSFNQEFALTKTAEVEESYVQLYKLNEMWFAYETILQFFKKNDKLKESLNGYQKFNVFKNLISNIQIAQSILDKANKQLEIELFKKESWKVDFEKFANMLVEDERTIKGTNTALKNLNKELPFNHEGLLVIIYGIRNTFVHQGETAKLGAKSYHSKIKLYKILYEYLVKLNFALLIEYTEPEFVIRNS